MCAVSKLSFGICIILLITPTPCFTQGVDEIIHNAIVSNWCEALNTSLHKSTVDKLYEDATTHQEDENSCKREIDYPKYSICINKTVI